MKRLFSLLSASLMFCLHSNAQVPQLLNYQGRITVGGTNYDGAGQFKFALVNANGSTNYWSNDGNNLGAPNSSVSLTVVKGLYSVMLGDTTIGGMKVPIAPSVFNNSEVYLRVWFNDGVNGFQQFSPDQRIVAVGYAMVAAKLDAESDVNGKRLMIGNGNILSGTNSTIAGGYINVVTNNMATISGGYGNVAGGYISFVGGGSGNLAGGIESVVAGGELNGAFGTISFIGGGYANLTYGYASSIPGGFANVAGGAYSLAAGTGANAAHDGSFVWSDAARTNVFSSSASNQFSVRCAGGARFFGNPNATTGVQLAPGGNAWSAASDRNLKENFKPIDARFILEKLVSTPITEWNLISQDTSIRHLGPMAQDFHASFGLGEDDRHISSTDADGIAFAAIQGLNAKILEKDAKIERLEEKIGLLEKQIQRIGQLLEQTKPVREVSGSTSASKP